MKKIKFKQVFTLIFLFTLTVLNAGITPIITKANTVQGGDILIDLRDTDLSEYENAGKTDVIYFAEKGFNSDKFSLTVYVYNAEKKELVKDTESNVINLACGFNSKNVAVEYANFRLQYISHLEDNSIYKFGVIDEDKKLEYAVRNLNNKIGKRYYKIAGIQLIGVGGVLATDYPIGKSYNYSGYENGLSHELDVVETIELELKDAWYRTASSDKGAYYQNQLNSVYFAVPNKYFDNGYTLNGIKAEWYEYKTQPIVVLENQAKYDVLKNYIGQDIGYYNSNIRYTDARGNKSLISLTYGRERWVNDAGGGADYDWGYNVPYTTSENIRNDNTVKKHDTALYYAFSTNGKPYNEFTVESEILKDYIYNYNKSNVNGYLPIKNGKISADLFQATVDDGRTKGYNVKTITLNDKFDLLSYKDTHSFWNTICDYGLFKALFGNTPSDESITEISPIHIVTENDLKDISKISNNLLIDEKFVNDFYKYVNDNASAEEPKTTCLFRFANNEYFSRELDNDVGFKSDGYVSEETVFLDFDIIHLDFAKGDEHIIYPVVSSPIDIVPSITPPPTYKSWLKYALIVVSSCLAGIGIYTLIRNLFKK